ncbi:MAG TPA: universal stress protein [Candidatus Dormibacteraeota bacterium]|nr:universal stress protein [Candidatus Dormibacteraeota bacterium]
MAQSFDGYKRVLLPIDFSDHCTPAAMQAAWMASRSGGIVHLAHVVVNPLDPIYEPEAVEHWVVVEHANAKARSLLEGIAATCLPADTPRELHILGGDPYAKLIDLAHDIDADLMVVSTHGNSNIAHLVMGGVAERVARHALCPVLLVRVPR